MKKIILSLTLLGILVLPVLAIAAPPKNPPVVGWNQLESFVIGTLFTIGGLIVVGALMISGIIFATAAGDPDKIKTARTALVYGVAGGVVLIIGASIMTIISGWL